MNAIVIDHAAQAAFRSRYQDRPWVTWESQANAVQIRWTVVAARVLNGDITAAEELRDAYIYGMVAKSWSEIGVSQRHLWTRALDAMKRAAESAERTAA